MQQPRGDPAQQHQAQRPVGPGAADQQVGVAPVEASVPTAWLVLVALAALAGAIAGTRLAVRDRRA